MVPERLAHYRIVEKLGAGAMGEVYLAEDTKLGRTVAIKILPPAFAENPERLARFIREARAASALNHPNVAHIYEIGEEEGFHFIAMERVVGEVLSARIGADGVIEYSLILDWGIQLADALDEAHGRGIVHRDIKPGNLIVTTKGQIKILDFGLAKIEPEMALGLPSELPTEAKTEPGLVMGTVSYMSPEQALGRQVDARSDLFSLGVVLYELTTGRRPFQGDGKTATIDQIGHASPEPMARFRSGVSHEHDRIVRKLLEKAPADCYQSARELQVDLRTLRRDSDSASVRGEAPHRRWFRASLWAASLAALVALGLYLIPPSGRMESVAVLPFENDATNPDSEYLSDGITGSVIVSLSRLRDVKVISRSASFRYKGAAMDPQVVGRELGVDGVVLGRVMQHGEEFTLAAELVDTRDGSLVWSDEYRRSLDDVLTVQRDLAKEISRELRGRLSAKDEDRLVGQETESVEAYQTYLKGRNHMQTRTEESFVLARQYFEQAIASDPGYALAYAGLADTLGLLGHYAYFPPVEAYRQGREAAEKAIELDDTLAETHTSLAWIAYNERRWRESEASFKNALEIDPDNAIARLWYALLLSTTGRHDEAVRNAKRVLELDPFSPFFNMYVGTILVWADRSGEAIERFRAGLELDANYVQNHRYLGQAYEKEGDLENAEVHYQKAIENSGGALGLGDLGHLYAVSGREREAREVLERLENPSVRRYRSPVEMVRVYAGLGEKDNLHEWLEKADAERAGEFLFLRFTPVGATLVGDPKFEQILKRMGL